MKILLTGGAGFIGSHIADAYLAAGHDVCVVDDLSTGFRRNLPEAVRFYEVDVRDFAELRRVFELERPEVVNHQAAKANIRESLEKPWLYADVNVLGAINLLECCRQFAIKKVIYASSGGAVYGEPMWLPVTEDHPLNPLDPYGASKHHVEHYLHIYKHNFGLNFTALRYPNVYGPRQNPNGGAGVVAIFSAAMLRCEQVVINGSGTQQRDFVHVFDIARANVLALKLGDNEILNVGSGIGTDINTIYMLVSELTGFTGRPTRAAAKPGEVNRIYLSSRRAFRVLAWQPSIPLKHGLQAMVMAGEPILKPV